ncbi:MAG: response regulator [Polyangiaceae bacterium]|jgi:two-component system, chemotaxis family, chemotaxis protein CheY|nr:response regulator [Polyangiaceae bacterium]
MKALIIDDSRATRTILRKILASLQFDVVEAPDGLEALRTLHSCDDIDLALVDWNMPQMNGLEFVHAVRRESVYDGLRLLMVTTESEAAQMQRALEAGANEYVMKPFTADTIRSKLQLLGLGCA